MLAIKQSLGSLGKYVFVTVAKKKKKGLPRSELGLDFRPLGLLWT